jgi:hypothetical protein
MQARLSFVIPHCKPCSVLIKTTGHSLKLLASIFRNETTMKIRHFYMNYFRRKYYVFHTFLLTLAGSPNRGPNRKQCSSRTDSSSLICKLCGGFKLIVNTSTVIEIIPSFLHDANHTTANCKSYSTLLPKYTT